MFQPRQLGTRKHVLTVRRGTQNWSASPIKMRWTSSSASRTNLFTYLLRCVFNERNVLSSLSSVILQVYHYCVHIVNADSPLLLLMLCAFSPPPSSYSTFSPKFALVYLPRKQPRSTWNFNTMCRIVSYHITAFFENLTFETLSPFETLARGSVCETLSRLAANAVTASLYTGVTQTLQRSSRAGHCSDACGCSSRKKLCI